jgi:2,3-bisphosphoglycerate-dependent phosphoglycerate mutase
VRLVKVADLRERDFGSAEGKRYGAPHADAETHEALRVRADRFVRMRLAPVLQAGRAGTVVVVSHGILLNALLRVLLVRFAPGELARLAASGTGTRLGAEYVASWSNTGYLEMVVGFAPAAARPSGGLVGSALGSDSGVGRPRPTVRLTVVKVNAVEHLAGLKKTRGGIGSAQFDSRQRTMDSFLAPASKKRKAEE